MFKLQETNISKRTFELFKPFNKDTTVINSNNTVLALLLSFFGMILLCISLLLLFIPHAKWYNHGYPGNCPPRKIALRLALGLGSRLGLVLGLGEQPDSFIRGKVSPR